MNTPLLYSCVPIAPSKTMTCCGSSRRAINGLSGNGRLRFCRSSFAAATNCVVLGLWMVDDHGRRRLLGEKLERLGEIHTERFLRGKELEHRGVVVEIGARAISPRVALTAGDA